MGSKDEDEVRTFSHPRGPTCLDSSSLAPVIQDPCRDQAGGGNPRHGDDDGHHDNLAAAVDAMLLSSLLSRGIRLHDKIRRGPTRGDSWVPCFDALP